jgi:hypothetical protein
MPEAFGTVLLRFSLGDGVLVVYERDGGPLDGTEGRIALVSLKDTRPGPRHVKWLQSIELRTLNE